jgi:ribosome-binding factor A
LGCSAHASSRDLNICGPGVVSKRARPPSDRGPSQRQLRAGELVRHALVDVLAREDLRDPDLVGVTVIVGEVRASPDLKHMTAFVAPLAAGDAVKIAAALTRCSRFLRGCVARQVDLKYTPELHFIADASYDEASRINQLLARDDVRRDLDAATSDD